MKPVELCGGEVSAWSEPGGPICVKAVISQGDPVEMSEEEVRQLIAVLEDFLNRIDK